MFVHPPVSSEGRPGCVRGFTLLELLVVLALLGVLATLALGAGSAAARRGQFDRARLELSRVAAALEAYRRHAGAYPPDGDGAEWFAALEGGAAPVGTAAETTRPPPCLDLAGLTLRHASPATPGNTVLDPWGEPYRYHRVARAYSSGGYALYSAGPDGRDRPPDASGRFDAAHPDNLDNVYPGPH